MSDNPPPPLHRTGSPAWAVLPRRPFARLNGIWMLRVFLVSFLGLFVVSIWAANLFLTQRLTDTIRNRAEIRLALYSGTIMSELQRSSVVPLLLSRDPVLNTALREGDFTSTSQRLISYLEEIGAASLVLLDQSGRVVAATDRARLGELRENEPFFRQAISSAETVFTSNEPATGRYDFTFSRHITENNQLLGVIMVEVNLSRVVDQWRGASEAVFITQESGEIILATEPRWRGLMEADALARQDAPSAIRRAIQNAGDWAFGDEGYIFGDDTLRLSQNIPFRGWDIVSYTAYASVRERVNGVLALLIMGFALVLAAAFYLLSRRARLQTAVFQRESAELRRLNDRLSREIAEREKAQRDLEQAELSLVQSQKLAALGEMSAAVSHELNQPLAAMKTYLAGAKLLLQRRRPEEAMSSFQRIDDLIERMGAITRQLKSYARKGGDSFTPVDLRDAVAGAMTMMEPQMRQMKVDISQVTPAHPVMVLGDMVRLEQVIINLLRNALDAMKAQEARQIEILLAEGDEAVLSVRDNGAGIEDLDQLFEPFYTTKKPGEGVGLGLAISSGIVTDFGGRLRARNGETGGAVFEIRLPRHQMKGAAE